MVRFILTSLAVALLASVTNADVVDLTNDNFSEHLSQKDFSVVKFFAPWCGHCKSMANDWLEAGKSFNGEKSVLVGNVDCTVEKELCGKIGVRGYPTLKSFKKEEFFDDKVPRKHAQIVEYVNKNSGLEVKAPAGGDDQAKAKPAAKSQDPVPASYVAGQVHIITTNNFEEFVHNSGKHVLLKVFAPWCGHCKNMAAGWVDFAKAMESRYDDVIIAEFDATANDLPSAYAIRGYPTVYWCDKSKKNEPEKFAGARNMDAWTAFVNEKAPAPAAVEPEVEAEAEAEVEAEVEAEAEPEVEAEAKDEL